jgi:NAD(P)-dependent dehydrogenase (short-subunit alcohol dehydrogenase family)
VTSSERRIAVVTEAPAGRLGLTMAWELAKHGFDVAVLAHLPRKGSEAMRGPVLREALSPLSFIIGLDLSEPAAVNRAKDMVSQELGPVNVLVNTASFCGGSEADMGMPSTEWRHILGAILDAAFNCCSAFVPGMVARGGGNIVNVFTPCSSVTHPHHVAIMAATGGVAGLTRALASDLGSSGVAINAVSSQSPMGGGDYLAATVCYLASPAARAINGEILGMDCD